MKFLKITLISTCLNSGTGFCTSRTLESMAVEVGAWADGASTASSVPAVASLPAMAALRAAAPAPAAALAAAPVAAPQNYITAGYYAKGFPYGWMKVMKPARYLLAADGPVLGWGLGTVLGLALGVALSPIALVAGIESFFSGREGSIDLKNFDL